MTNALQAPAPAPFYASTTAPGAEYQQSLRGPGHRGWRPLLSILLVFVFGGISTILVGLGLMLWGLFSGHADPLTWAGRQLTDFTSPIGFLALNLSLIALIPASLLALWLAHGVRPGQVVSVVGRFRWRWFGRCVAVLIPLWLVLIGVSFLLDGGQVGARPQQWGVLMVIMLLTTPLQSAAEEVAFRGWALLSLGSWFRNRWTALVVPLVLSVVTFAAAHGSADPWIFADLAVFAAIAGLLTWRTGGLEAAIALHAVNNVVALGSALLLGGFGDGFIDSDTAGSPAQFVSSLTVQGIACWLLWRQAGKAQLVRLTPSVPSPAPVSGPPVGGPPVGGPPVTGPPVSGPPVSGPPVSGGWPGAGTGSG